MIKRGLEMDEQGEAKRARGAADIENASAVHVYAPCVSIHSMAHRMNSLVEVLLPAKYLTSDCKSMRLRRLWGTDVYTDDSDLVAVLVHTGHVKLKSAAPKTPLLVSLRVCPPQPTYPGSERNGLKSRSWSKEHVGAAYKIERCLQHTAGAMPPPELSMLRPGPTRQIQGSLCPQAAGPGDSFMVPPAACTVVFNLSNEPCYKYSLPLVADQATEPSRWTSSRLKREAFYLESHQRRFELARSGTKKGIDEKFYDVYRLSQVLRPHAMDRRAMEATGVPLPEEHVKVLHAEVDWEELHWGPRVRGVEYPLVRIHFMSHTVAT